MPASAHVGPFETETTWSRQRDPRGYTFLRTKLWEDPLAPLVIYMKVETSVDLTGHPNVETWEPWTTFAWEPSRVAFDLWAPTGVNARARAWEWLLLDAVACYWPPATALRRVSWADPEPVMQSLTYATAGLIRCGRKLGDDGQRALSLVLLHSLPDDYGAWGFEGYGRIRADEVQTRIDRVAALQSFLLRAAAKGLR